MSIGIAWKYFLTPCQLNLVSISPHSSLFGFFSQRFDEDVTKGKKLRNCQKQLKSKGNVNIYTKILTHSCGKWRVGAIYWTVGSRDGGRKVKSEVEVKKNDRFGLTA